MALSSGIITGCFSVSCKEQSRWKHITFSVERGEIAENASCKESKAIIIIIIRGSQILIGIS